MLYLGNLCPQLYHGGPLLDNISSVALVLTTKKGANTEKSSIISLSTTDRQNLTRTIQIYVVTNPRLIVSQDVWPGNESGLFYTALSARGLHTLPNSIIWQWPKAAIFCS